MNQSSVVCSNTLVLYIAVMHLHSMTLILSLMYKFREVGGSTPLGRWTSGASNTKLLSCSGSGDTVTHSSGSPKLNAVFVWEAPDNVTKDLQVV